MLATVRTCAALGLEAQMVEVQGDIARQGLPQFLMAGLPDNAIVRAGSATTLRPFLNLDPFDPGQR